MNIVAMACQGSVKTETVKVENNPFPLGCKLQLSANSLLVLTTAIVTSLAANPLLFQVADTGSSVCSPSIAIQLLARSYRVRINNVAETPTPSTLGRDGRPWGFG